MHVVQGVFTLGSNQRSGPWMGFSWGQLGGTQWCDKVNLEREREEVACLSGLLMKQ